jgi:hypothetical protein
MKFNKIKKLLKKDEKKLDTNPINDMFHALTPDEPVKREPAAEEEVDDLEDIKERKRKRYEEIMKKYK